MLIIWLSLPRLRVCVYFFWLSASHDLRLGMDGMRQYYPRKLLGPLKSGMGRGLRPSVASLVERTPAARPLLCIGRASGSTSGSASRGGWAAEIFILLPRDFGSSYLFAYNDTKSGPTLFFALTICQSSPLSYHPAGFGNPFRGGISSGQYGSIIRASC